MSVRLVLYLLSPPHLELNITRIIINRAKCWLSWRISRLTIGDTSVISALLWSDHEQNKAFTNLH
jgi:hypothetical protein